MAIQSSVSSEEIEQIEEATQKSNRKSGFALMSVRDRGWAYIQSINGQRIRTHWHVDREPEEYEVMRNVPPGHFLMVTDDAEILVDAEQLRKWLRWA